MIVLDANYILRFLLKDNDAMYAVAEETIASNVCFVDNEVFAEVVFVLLKVYSVKKSDIRATLERFVSFENIRFYDKEMIVGALKIFDEKNLDFVDALLCMKSKKYIVKTFDKKLRKCMESLHH